MEATLKPPLSQRINLRLLVFLVIIAGIVGYPVYQFIAATVTGGITDAGGGYKAVDIKAMSLFLFDQNNGTLEDIPAKWRALDGQKVILEGEIWAPSSAGPYLSTYQLCYSITKCCFSGPPQVQHFVDSKPINGAKLSYHSGLVKAKGILHVHVYREAGKVQSVYQMDVQSLEPVE